jgi:predicted nucleotidyltransferase/uncharacterized protein (UPF0332 family)
MAKKVSKKKVKKKRASVKKVSRKKVSKPEVVEKLEVSKKVPTDSKITFAPQVSKLVKKEKHKTMLIVGEREIALDFATKVYKEFDQMIKSIVLFGSSARRKSSPGSDIDIIVIIDDVSVKWDMELIAWYREELGKLIQKNPYRKPLHINSVKLSTWWNDLLKGDPVIMNVLRYGDSLIDVGGFFNPLKILLHEGKIRATPEAIYTLLQRAPHHLARASTSMLGAVDGLYWTVVDAAHAVLIAANVTPPSPEAIADILMEKFVKTKKLDKKFVRFYDEIHHIAKEIIHGNIEHIKGSDIDQWFVEADAFLSEMAGLVDKILEEK